MSQIVRVRLSRPVQVFLGEYIVNGSLDIRHNTPLGNFILTCIDICDHPTKGRPIEKDVVKIKVPAQLKNGLDGRTSYFYVSESKQKAIDGLFQFIMEKELFDRLDLIHERGEVKKRNGKQAAEIRAFILKYSGDSDDLSFDTLVKRYQRYKKRPETLMDSVFQKNM